MARVHPSTAETRIPLTDASCDGCDCGGCVSAAINDLGGVEGVSHVRYDRQAGAIIVRHTESAGRTNVFNDIIAAYGLEPTS